MWGQSRNWRAHSQGSFLTTPFLGCSSPLIIPSTMTASTPTTSSRWTGMPDIFTSVNTSRQPCGVKVDTTTQIHRDCQVLAGGQCSPHSYWPPSGVDNFTRPFGGDHHGCHDIHTAAAGCHDGHHLHRFHDDFYEPSQFGASPPGGWLPYGCLRRCYRCGGLKMVVTTSTQSYWHWCHLNPSFVMVHPCIELCCPKHSYLGEL